MINRTNMISGDSFRNESDLWFACTTDEKLECVSGIVKARQHSENIIDYVNAFDLELIKENSIVFCKTDYLSYFVDHCSAISVPFNLVTGQSDFSITDQMVQRVKNQLNVSWWATNCNSSLANPIPLGIANSFCPVALKENFKKNNKPNNLLYVNHREQTNEAERKWLRPHFSKFKWSTITNSSNNGGIVKYQEDLVDHKFVLCPPGNGIDTHRLWEALYSGVIPIVKRHRTHSNLEAKLPILFVDDYRQVTENLLNDTYEEYKEKQWNLEMLTASWWMNAIRKQGT